MTDMLKEFGFNTGKAEEIETGNMPTILKWSCTNGGGWSTYEGKDENDKAIYKPVAMPEKVVVDMPGFQRGWRKWVDRKPTDVLAKVEQDGIDRPSDDWDPVIVMNLYSPDLDFCQFASSTQSVIRSIASLFNTYRSRTESAPHLVPLCKTGVESFTTKNGEFHVPTFNIVKYVSRPVQLIGEGESPEPTAKPKAETKPAPKPAPVEDEFGDELPEEWN